jgi:caffeoyl-CoA O-methyltransferase
MAIVSSAIESYAADHSSKQSPVLKKLVQVTHKNTDSPRMQVGHLEGLFLELLVKAARARRVLEIGTFTGYSALTMAQALPKNGQLTTLDINPTTTKIALSYWKQAGQQKKIKVILGPAIESLKKLKGPFDVVFIDADKQNYHRYWNACIPKVRRGGIILVDNVLWGGNALKPHEKMGRAIAAFNRAIKKDRRVDLVMLTVRDGITMAVKK